MLKTKKNKLYSAKASVSLWKILLPSFLGVAVVMYMLWKDFEISEFNKLSWNFKTAIFLGLTVVVLIIRHLSYSWRLRIISDYFFSWKKSIELIFIWEFSSTVSPTALGGSATALIFLTQEQLKSAKAVTIVLYSVVLDTLYFLVSLLLLIFILGPIVIRPELTTIWSNNGYAMSFWLVFLLMTTYGSFFYYGLFIDPGKISAILRWLGRLPLLKRFNKSFQETADDVLVASEELKNKNWPFHFRAFLATSIAWLGKFSTIGLIAFAVIQRINPDFYNYILLLGRYEIMFAITAFSPTPGGSGVAEALFGGFFKDFISDSAAIIVTIFWRLMTYYFYLFAGAIIIPFWIRRILSIRKLKKLEEEKIGDKTISEG